MTSATVRDPVLATVATLRAQPEWRALAKALRDRGPAVCERTPDAELWWPSAGGDAAVAVSECRRCPVLAECAGYALAARERHGVWGATTAAERVG